MSKYDSKYPNQVELYGNIVENSSYKGSTRVRGVPYVPAIIRVVEINQKQRSIPILLQEGFEPPKVVSIYGQLHTASVINRSNVKVENKLFVYPHKISEVIPEKSNYVFLEGIIKSKPFYKINTLRKEFVRVWIDVPNVEGYYSSIACMAFGKMARRISNMQKGMMLTIEGKIRTEKGNVDVLICKKF